MENEDKTLTFRKWYLVAGAFSWLFSTTVIIGGIIIQVLSKSPDKNGFFASLGWWFMGIFILAPFCGLFGGNEIEGDEDDQDKPPSAFTKWARIAIPGWYLLTGMYTTIRILIFVNSSEPNNKLLALDVGQVVFWIFWVWPVLVILIVMIQNALARKTKQ